MKIMTFDPFIECGISVTKLLKLYKLPFKIELNKYSKKLVRMENKCLFSVLDINQNHEKWTSCSSPQSEPKIVVPYILYFVTEFYLD